MSKNCLQTCISRKLTIILKSISIFFSDNKNKEMKEGDKRTLEVRISSFYDYRYLQWHQLFILVNCQNRSTSSKCKIYSSPARVPQTNNLDRTESKNASFFSFMQSQVVIFFSEIFIIHPNTQNHTKTMKTTAMLLRKLKARGDLLQLSGLGDLL